MTRSVAVPQVFVLLSKAHVAPFPGDKWHNLRDQCPVGATGAEAAARELR